MSSISASAQSPLESPLTFAQESRLLKERALASGIPRRARMIGGLLELRRAVQPDGLTAAIAALSLRHSALRISIEERDGNLVQRINPGVLQPEIRDLRSLQEGPAWRQVMACSKGLLSDGLDIHSGAMGKFVLFRLPSDRQILVFAVEHLVTDGWSVHVLIRNLVALCDHFSGVEAHDDLLEVAPSFTAFAERQRTLAGSGAWRDGIAFWRRQLEGLPLDGGIEIPTRTPLHEVATRRVEVREWAIDSELLSRLASTFATNRVTPFMGLLSAVGLAVQGLYPVQDFGIFSFFANRRDRSLHELVGWISTTHLLRINLPSAAASLADVLKATRDCVLTSQTHEAIPFPFLLYSIDGKSDLGPPRRPSLSVASSVAGLGREHGIQPNAPAQRLAAMPRSAGPSQLGRGRIAVDLLEAPTGARVQLAMEAGRFPEDEIASLGSAILYSLTSLGENSSGLAQTLSATVGRMWRQE